jgi:hypothetical protein
LRALGVGGGDGVADARGALARRTDVS